MKNLATTLRLTFATTGMLLLLGGFNLVHAQGPGSGGPRPGATNVPIDGGASLLLAAGGAYGLRRLRRAKRR
ncbi:PID-CTERM protein-sorting domain-containing protein [Hymenobacter algoricola]|uniref:VPDSG-CTERM sorting domain-containing protein n=1 Tax=Hymenobacter algoricola TaxID=486267 RepID=A0ABP7MPU5_9BACT